MMFFHRKSPSILQLHRINKNLGTETQSTVE
jgi:hypothetical protein